MIEATGPANPASREAAKPEGAPEQVATAFSIQDLMLQPSTPLETSIGGFQQFSERLAAIYNVKRAGLFTTDNLAPRPDNALSRVGHELQVGNGVTGRSRIDKEFNDLKMTNTHTLDDFRGLGKVAALRRYGL